MTKAKLEAVQREVFRVAVLIIIGLMMIHLSPQYAMAWGIPALSPWGLFVGGMFIAAALSHIMRRALFPKLDLQAIATRAIMHESMSAAVVFVAICAVLITLLILTASMLRM